MASLKGLGTEDKRKVAIAAGLGVVVLALAFNTLFGGGSPTPAPPSVPVRPAAAAVAPTAARGQVTPATNTQLDPALHPELMAETENFLYAGSGRNIFSLTSAPPPIEQVKAPVRPSMQQPPLPVAVNPGPPRPPAVDLKFFGFASKQDGARRAFLTHGEDVFVAAEGDVVSHRYKVVSIAPTSVQIEDLPFHDTQTLPLVN